MLNLGAFCRMTERTLKLFQHTGYLPFKLLPNNGVMKENRHITPFNLVFISQNALKWCNDSGV